MRASLVGELGYEIHVENTHCAKLYNKILNIGANYGLKNAGFRALYSLSCEKGKSMFIDFEIFLLKINFRFQAIIDGHMIYDRMIHLLKQI